MISKLKSLSFSVFQRVAKLLWGRGLGKIPGALATYDFLFQNLCPNKTIIDVQGSRMLVDRDKLPKRFKGAFRDIILLRMHEKLTTDMFKKVIKEGDVVVDLGANIGYFTLLAARLVGQNGKVYAFEPEPTNYALLVKNIELNGYNNVVAVQKAVSNVMGNVRLFIDSRDTGANSIYQPDTTGEFVKVESVTLDEFLKDKKHPVDVIKMDVEGAEMAALSGMERIIRDNPDLKIFMEFYFSGIEQAGNTPEEFARKLLEDYGFSILAIGDYTKDKKYLRINSVSELMNLCRGKKTANLLLQKGQTSSPA